MPGSDGLTAAREIRNRDDAVAIIFITNMAQYAIHGYEVNAIDFMIKPVGYFNFAQKLGKAMRFLQRRCQRTVLLTGEDGVIRLAASDIRYVEKDRDNLIYHTRQGTFRKRGTMKAEKELLQGLPFEECTVGCSQSGGSAADRKGACLSEGGAVASLQADEKRVYPELY